jgi:hypothetical protein
VKFLTPRAFRICHGIFLSAPFFLLFYVACGPVYLLEGFLANPISGFIGVDTGGSMVFYGNTLVRNGETCVAKNCSLNYENVSW